MIYILTIFQIIMITLINNDINDSNKNNYIHKQQLIIQH